MTQVIEILPWGKQEPVYTAYSNLFVASRFAFFVFHKVAQSIYAYQNIILILCRGGDITNIWNFCHWFLYKSARLWFDPSYKRLRPIRRIQTIIFDLQAVIYQLFDITMIIWDLTQREWIKVQIGLQRYFSNTNNLNITKWPLWIVFTI